MVTVQNHLGKITFSKQFFASLIGGTVTNCFGVVGMNAGSTKQSLLEVLPFFKDKTYIDKGVTVRLNKGKLLIGLHISVMYGVNVAAVVKSIQNKVRYAIEQETGLTVEKISVFVDGLRS